MLYQESHIGSAAAEAKGMKSTQQEPASKHKHSEYAG